ncbi:glycoside hydrolase family 15 protein [Jannaschia aquimarina]|uniref:Trehalase n=1 Tax=Jannaschia aquimarina TaxID=935700 RepID=A0A0D1ECV2_9RHOB|nr:glycoside hydrolase family 15 protein [Jannaschia aquimarina]KIT15559.1 Trehalase [Jannaschia aquimarina]SNT26934.1 hypothetical protein SAMN05421775_109110 [Jannaschia aquimarina]
MKRAWNDEAETFMQSYGGSHVDASLLLLPLSTDTCRPITLAWTAPWRRSRIASTSTGGCFGMRKEEAGDGFEVGQGAFLLCSFWHVEVLAMRGETDRAIAIFDRLLSLRNDLGLLAEEYDPRDGRQLGNVPQAFSHVGIVGAAVALSKDW